LIAATHTRLTIADARNNAEHAYSSGLFELSRSCRVGFGFLQYYLHPFIA
jgi:hypothetical protein